MKKTLLAATLATALSPALAQTSVNMYGVADAGVSFDRSGAPGAGTAFRVNSGYLSSSRLGFTGTEDLGGGLKGVFTLELGFGTDTGEFRTTAAGGAGFNRRAFVGVQGGFGTLALGRDYTPLYWGLQAGDVQAYGLYGSLQNAQFMSNTGSNQFFRADNAIFYTSPKIAGGLTVRGVVSAGGGAAAPSCPSAATTATTINVSGESFDNASACATVPGGQLYNPSERGRLYAIGGEYAAGPLTVAAAYQRTTIQTSIFSNATDERQDAMISAKYNFGAFSLGGGAAQVEVPFANGTDSTRQLYWVGGTVKLGAGTLLAQFSQMRFDSTDRPSGSSTDPRGNTFSIGYTYPFSRRTTGYVSYGQVKNNATGLVPLYASDNNVSPGSARGADPRGIAIGVRHSF